MDIGGLIGATDSKGIITTLFLRHVYRSDEKNAFL